MKHDLSRSPTVLKQLGLTAALGLLGLVSARVGPIRDQSPLFWLPVGVALAVLVKSGLGWWPAVVLGAAFNAATQVSIMSGVGPAMSILLGNSIGVIVSAWLLRNRLAFQEDMQRFKDVLSFLLVGVFLVGIIDASFGLISLTADGYNGFARWQIVWAKWFAVHAASSLIIAPLIFAWTSAIRQTLTFRRAMELVALVMVAILAGFVFLSDDRPAWSLSSPFSRPFFLYPIATIFFPIVVVAALRLGQLGVTACVATIAIITLLSSLRLQGAGTGEPAVALIQRFSTIQGMMAAGGMMLAGIAAQCANAMSRSNDLTTKYQRLVETCTEGIWEVDREWRTTFVNHRMAELLGVTPDAMMGKHLFEFMDDDARRICQGNMNRRTNGIEETHDFRFRHASGRDVWMLLATAPILGTRGEFAGAVAMCTDITERKQVDERLRISEARYRLLFEENVAAAFVSSADGSIRETNMAFARLFGYASIEEVNIANAESFYAIPGARAEYLAALHKHGVLRDYELKYRRKDGTQGYLIENVRLIPDEWGVKNVFFGTIIDITARKAAEEALSDNEERIRAIFENAGIGIAEISFDNRIRRVNGYLANLLGYSADELAGMLSFSLTDPADLASSRECVQRMLAGEISQYNLKKRYVTKAGKPIWCDLTVVLRKDASGDPQSMIGVVKDISEQVRTESEKAEFHRILEGVATGRPLSEILETAVQVQEHQMVGAICSILLRNDETNTLHTGAAPNLPEAYCEAINGLKIAAGAGCCGTAAAENRVVIVEDIDVDPLWNAFRPLAQKHGLRACWSQPIVSTTNEVLGTFATYYKVPRRPTSHDLHFMEEIGHIVGIAIERHHANEALRISEAKLRMIVENEPECVKIVSTDGRLIEMNPAGLNMIEADHFSDVAGRPILNLIVPEYHNAYKSLHQQACQGVSGIAAFRIRGLRGGERWMEASSVPWKDERGAITAVLSVTRDITSRKLAEEILRTQHEELESRVSVRTTELAMANETLLQEISERRRAELNLQESEERFRQLYNSTFEGILLHMGSRILEANEPILRMFGYSRDELLQLSRGNLIAEESRNDMRATYGDQTDDRDSRPVPALGLRKDGTRFPIELQSKEIPLDGTMVRVTAIRDLTERQRASELIELHREDLAHVQRLSTMGEMATGLAHELNQPLAAIASYTQGSVRRLKSETPEIGPVVQAMEVVAEQAHRAGEIIRRIREMVRKREPQTSRCELGQVCKDAAELIAGEIRRGGISLQLTLPEYPIYVQADKIQIEQVLINLLKNACESLRDGDVNRRMISLRIDSPTEFGVKVTIEDSGPGIPVEYTGRVFDAFYSTKSQGMGMGLSISRSIIEAHGGRLIAEKTAVSGAAFTMTFPPERVVS
ncbi:MAG: PAS domain S-box protein [Planctomycetota bacterium]